MASDLVQLKNRVLSISAKIAFGLLTLFYFFIVYMIIAEGWTVHFEGIGDLLAVLVLTSYYLLIGSLFYMANKYGFIALYFIVILASAFYIWFVPSKMGFINPQNDHRAQDIRKLFPDPTHNQKPDARPLPSGD